MFHLGRTDTIRSASTDSLAFVKGMDDSNLPVRGLEQGWVVGRLCLGHLLPFLLVLCANGLHLYGISAPQWAKGLTEDEAMNLVLSFLATEAKPCIHPFVREASHLPRHLRECRLSRVRR